MDLNFNLGFIIIRVHIRVCVLHILIHIVREKHYILPKNCKLLLMRDKCTGNEIHNRVNIPYSNQFELRTTKFQHMLKLIANIIMWSFRILCLNEKEKEREIYLLVCPSPSDSLSHYVFWSHFPFFWNANVW